MPRRSGIPLSQQDAIEKAMAIEQQLKRFSAAVAAERG
jgi:hypothetical protein